MVGLTHHHTSGAALYPLVVGLAVMVAFGSYLFVESLLTKRLARSARNLRQVVPKSPEDVKGKKTVVLGYFHPYCNAGGGGERVIWQAVASMQVKHPDVFNVIYTGDVPAASKADILKRAMTHFNIELKPETIHFVPLPSRAMIGDKYWRRLTLFGQAWGSACVAWEALLGEQGIVPDIYIDTMGFAFTYPVVKLIAGWKIPLGAYIHYPTISTDMLLRVKTRTASHTNVATAGSAWKSFLKLQYYRLFAVAYRVCLRLVDVRMANSTWTRDHIVNLLGGAPSAAEIVYPPCDTTALGKIPIADEGKRERIIISLAQFRPEKNHAAQLHALAELFRLRPEWKDPTSKETVRLVMIGSSRDEADAERVEKLRVLAMELGVEANFELAVNASYDVLLGWLARASVGIATMIDEHFGINVVEFMAAGLIPLSHASAGPLLDIIVPFDSLPTGYHALTPPEFGARLVEIFELPAEERAAMRARARRSVEVRFGREAFETGWEREWGVLKETESRRRGERSKVE